jgi:hypothetical protein
MKNVGLAAASLLVLSLCACPWASAQSIPQGFDLFAEFGPSCLEGPVHSSATGEAKCETGRFFGGGRLRLTRHDAFEVSHSYSPDIFDESYPLLYENARLTSNSFNYVRYLSTARVQPFATIGVGWEKFLGTTVDTEFAWNCGAGVDFIPQRFIAVRFEFRDYLASIPLYHTSRLQNLVPSVGIVFRFNRNKKL